MPPGDPGWFRYSNARYGLRVDLPDSGFRQALAPGGHGIVLTSPDRAVTIVVHANRRSPEVFNAIRVTYPQAIEQELDSIVTRVSLSLRAMCPSRIE